MARRRKAKPRRARRLLLLLLIAVAAGYVWWQREITNLRARRDRLRVRLAEVAREGRLLASAPRSDIAVGVPRAYAQGLVEDVAAHLLDRVELDLSGLRVSKRGEVEKKVLGRAFLLGEWRVDLHVERLRGMLQAGRPRLSLLGNDDVALVLPVTVREGRLDSRLRFRWDSRGVAMAVCRDFSVSERAQASIVPQTHEIRGRLSLVAEGARIGVRSRLDRRKLHVHVRPTEGTWARARRALERQDSFWKCGVALKPDSVLEGLRELVAQGFEITLPADLVPPLRLPASFRGQIEQDQTPLTLGVRVDALRATREAFWYGAQVVVDSPNAAGLRSAPSPVSAAAGPRAAGRQR